MIDITLTDIGIALGTGAIHFPLGALYMWGCFSAIERGNRDAVLFTLGYAVVLLGAETLVGMAVSPTLLQFKGMIWASAVGFMLGTGLVALFWKPTFPQPEVNQHETA